MVIDHQEEWRIEEQRMEITMDFMQRRAFKEKLGDLSRFGEHPIPTLPMTYESIFYDELKIVVEKSRKLSRDLRDCLDANRTVFERCKSCGHLREKGLICGSCGDNGNDVVEVENGAGT